MNFIFDVDGTLVNSYPCIVDKVLTANKMMGVNDTPEYVFDFIIKSSIVDYIKFTSAKYKLDEQKYNQFLKESHEDIYKIELMPEVKKTLIELVSKDHKLFIFTHRGKTLLPLLKLLGIFDYFVGIIDSTMGLPRKPSGDAVKYIIDKYSLNSDECFYVGDREIDILCAKDANIKSIFFQSSGIVSKSSPTYSIEKFSDLLRL